MEIKVLFDGTSPFEGIESGDTVAIEDGETLSGFLARHHVKKEFLEYVISFVNGEHRSLSHVLRDKDEVKFFVPVSGG